MKECIIEGCSSKSGLIQHRGVTFHTFPLDQEQREIWIRNCKVNPKSNIAKNSLVCSRHFRRNDFDTIRANKYMLKSYAVPTIFPWGKAENQNNLNTIETSEGAHTDMLRKGLVNTENTQIAETAITNETDKTPAPIKRKAEGNLLIENENKAKKLELDLNIASDSSIPETPPINKLNNFNVDEVKNSNLDKTEPHLDFSLGTKIEAKDFNGLWHSARVIELDHDEKEVLIRFEKPGKSRNTNSTEEWIPMKSSRLRQKTLQSTPKISVSFTIGEKVFARWSGPRRYPAVINKIIGNDSYEVLFEDGLTKVVKSSQINKVKLSREKRKSVQKATEDEKTIVDTKSQWPLISIDSLNLEELNLPTIPNDGEWCCHWVNDQPIGKEGFLTVGDHKKPTVIVDDWRLPLNWVKHMYQRSNLLGKWDVILVNPNGKRFRSKADLKQYLEELGQQYNPDIYDFSIHRRRAKDIGAYVYTKEYKIQKSVGQQSLTSTPKPEVIHNVLPSDINQFTPIQIAKTIIQENSNIVSTPEQAKDFVEGNPEDCVYLGSLKVQIVDNLFQCPHEGCTKNFRKELHLQMHVKHYHKDIAKLLGNCPNMQDLAYKRTIGTPKEETLPKNHLPNVKFFAKLHQQDLQNKTHRKTLTPTTSAACTPPQAFQPSELIQTPKYSPNVMINNFETEDNKIPVEISDAPSDTVTPNQETEVTSSIQSGSELLEISNIVNSENLTQIKLENETKIKEKTKKKTKIIDNKTKPRQKFLKSFSERATRRGSRQRWEKKFLNSSTLSSKDKKLPVDESEVIKQQPIIISALDEKPTRKAKNVQIVLPTEMNVDPNINNVNNISEQNQSPQYINENGEIIKIVRMRREEIINCLCSYGEEDGLMIQCELCLCWQHGICNGIEKESQVPDKYVCYICRNPQRGRESLKYIHDQDWLYEGKLPIANYHAKNQNTDKRFEILKKSHTLTGNLLELKKCLYSLKVKINIAENKDHPKMYLWAKTWDDFQTNKKELSENIENQISEKIENKPEIDNDDNKEKIISEVLDEKQFDYDNIEKQSKAENSIPMDQQILDGPQPEAPIDSTECQNHLMEHIKSQQLYAMKRVNEIESYVIELESLAGSSDIDSTDYSKTKQTISLLIRDLEKMQKIAKINKIHPIPDSVATQI